LASRFSDLAIHLSPYPAEVTVVRNGSEEVAMVYSAMFEGEQHAVVVGEKLEALGVKEVDVIDISIKGFSAYTDRDRFRDFCSAEDLYEAGILRRSVGGADLVIAVDASMIGKLAVYLKRPALPALIDGVPMVLIPPVLARHQLPCRRRWLGARLPYFIDVEASAEIMVVESGSRVFQAFLGGETGVYRLYGDDGLEEQGYLAVTGSHILAIPHDLARCPNSVLEL